MAAVVVDTTTSANAMFGRSVSVTSTGRIWTMHYSLADTRFEFWYSDDTGATFTEATSLRKTVVGSPPVAYSFHINTVTDRAVWTYGYGSYSYWFFVIGITTTSSWTTGTDVTTTFYPADTGASDIVSFDKPGSSNWFVAYLYGRTSSNGIRITIQEYTSAGAYVADKSPLYLGIANTTGNNHRLDFRHTGGADPSTVASSSPDLFVCTGSTSAITYFYKLSYSAGSWTVGSQQSIVASGGDGTHRAAIFDGTRFVMAIKDSSPTTDVLVYERDAADTTTTTRTPPSLTSAVDGLDISYDSLQNIYLFAADATNDDIWYVKYDRAGNSWGSWTTLEASTSSGTGYGTLSVTRGYPQTKIGALWLAGTGSPFSVTYEAVQVNVAPQASTWASPPNNSAQDAAATVAIDWDFVDSPGDTQSAYALKRVISGTTTYYNAGTSGWDVGEVKNTSTTSGVTMPATWAAPADSVALSVKTWDAIDTVGVYSSTLTLLGSTVANPTVTAPATNATVTVASPTISWTVSSQSAYQVRILTSASALIFSTGKVTSASTSITLPYSLTTGLVDIKCEVTTWNSDGLICSATSITTGIDVTFTPPGTPVLTVTAVPASGYISVAIADPAPGVQVSYHDIYVRVKTGGTQSGERTVAPATGIRIATGVAEDGTFLDRAAASGTDYEYRTQTFGVNGSTTNSAWTG